VADLVDHVDDELEEEVSLSVDEFKCKHCGKVALDSAFFARIRRARVIADTPFLINSGYRCPEHNAEIGSTSTNHTSGKAVDIAAIDGPSRGKILKGLYGAGFTRVGIAKTFIHCDTSDGVESAWLYT
jgi:zinc D-Ala-D-Ala carboxypeptidase